MSGWSLAGTGVLRHAGFPFDWLEELGFPDDVVAALDAALEAESTACRQSALAAARAAVAGALPLLRERLRHRACDARVQEAVFLSNPDVYANVWERYTTRTDLPNNARWRRVERQVYAYLQRLCAKNETTSFFGPMGYVDEVPGDGFSVTWRDDPPRRTFVATWAVRDLVAAMEGDVEVAVDLPLRRNPMFSLDDDVVRCEALDVEQKLPRSAAALLRAAEGEPTLREAARCVGLDVGNAHHMGRSLARLGALVGGIRLDEQRPEVFEQLVDVARRLPAGPGRRRWVGRLGELAGVRERFAGGTLAERRSALAEAEACFCRLTGEPARRGAGRIYADRLLFYEEAGSSFAVRAGTRVLERLAAHLSAGLEVSAACGEAFQRDVARALTGSLGPGNRTSLLRFVLRASELASERTSLPAIAIGPEDAGGDARETGCIELDALGPPASPGARYALPDVGLAAPSTEAVSRGDAQVVLARVHHHLLVESWLSTFYPDPEHFRRVAAGWIERAGLGERLLAPAFRRRNKGFYRYPGRQVALTAPATDGPAVLAADLEVVSGDDGLPALLDPGGHRAWLYLPLADFVTYPPYVALSHTPVLHAPVEWRGEAVPRVEIGGATYQRRRWRLDVRQLAALDTFDLVLELHRLRRRHGLPRFVFVRVPGERKPFLVDCTNPFAAALLRHKARDAVETQFEEMLPGPSDLWLRDPRGQRYTCELRLQAERKEQP